MTVIEHRTEAVPGMEPLEVQVWVQGAAVQAAALDASGAMVVLREGVTRRDGPAEAAVRAATMVEHAGAPPGAMLVRACPADDAGAEGAFEAGEPWVAAAARTPCRWRVLEGVSPSAAGRLHAVTLAGTRYALRYARWRPVHGAR